MLLINPKTRVVVLNPSPNVYRFPLPCHNNTPEINTIVQSVSPHRWSKTAAVIHYQKECEQSLIYTVSITCQLVLLWNNCSKCLCLVLTRCWFQGLWLWDHNLLFLSLMKFKLQLVVPLHTEDYLKKPLPCILGSVWSLHCTEEDSQTKSATEPWNKERQIISNK